MAAMEKRVLYRVGFVGDTSGLMSSLGKAARSLQELGTSPKVLTAGLKDSADAALQLYTHLRSAYNINTGKLDLTRFRQELERSGNTLESYATKLHTLGPEGEKAFLNVASAIGAAELPLRRSNVLMDSLWTSMKNTARWRLTTGVLNVFIGGIQAAYGYAKGLDESLNSIRIVTQKSAADMANFAKQANEAAKALNTTTTTYADASLIYYQQGLPDDQVEDRVATTIKMANVAGQTAETISQQMTAVWNNFDDGSRSLESYADTMVALGASTATSSKEIAEGLEKFAPVAQTIGLSFDYASAALATITATTRESASIVGTALRTLFSRLEGLKLGETLDDGTDLNKYSQALYTVGVDIKDANGQLKDMDTILDELGQKWGNLARDEKVALAETVAGVRQYSQLMALMENWDFFQQNLATARGSEGALQKQADIYAESWEAARDRVRAAAEDVYDSLLNPQVFKFLDSALTPFLGMVARTVDALGGMRGLILSLPGILNAVFGAKIQDMMRDMAINIGLLVTKSEAARARAVQASVQPALDKLNLEYDTNIVDDTEITILKERIKLEGEFNARADQYTKEQLEQVENERAIISLLEQRARISAKAQRSREDAVDETKTKITEDLPKLQEGALQRVQERINKTKEKTRIPIQVEFDEDSGTVVRDLFDRLQEALRNSDRKLQYSIDDILQIEDEDEQSQAMQKLLGLGDVDPDYLRDYFSEMYAGNVVVSELKQSLIDLGVPAEEVRKLAIRFNALADAEEETAASTERLSAESEEVIENISTGAIRATVDWTTALVNLGTAITQINFVMQGISNILDIFSRLDSGEELDFSETATQAISSLLLTLPVAINLLNAVKTSLVSMPAAWSAFTTATAAGTGAVAAFGGVVAAAVPWLTVIGVLIVAAVKIVDYFGKANERAEKKIKVANDRLAEARQELQEYRQELETAKNRLEELYDLADQRSLSVTEQEETEELERQVQLLEYKAQLTERLSNIQAAESFDTFMDARKDLDVYKSVFNQPFDRDSTYNTNISKILEDSYDEIYRRIRKLNGKTRRELVARIPLEIDDQNLREQIARFLQQGGDFPEFSQAMSQAMAKALSSSVVSDAGLDFTDIIGNLTQYEAEAAQKTQNQLEEYRAGLLDGLQKYEEAYSQGLAGLSVGKTSKDDLEELLDELIKVRKAAYGDDKYIEVYIDGAIRSTSRLIGSINQVQKILSDPTGAEEFYKQIEEACLNAGVRVDELASRVNEIFGGAKGLADRFGIGDLIDWSDDNQVQLLFDLRNETDFENFYKKLLQITGRTQSVVIEVSTALDEGFNALNTLMTGGTIKNSESLVEAFRSVGVDLSGFDSLTIADQIEALKTSLMDFTGVDNNFVAQLKEDITVGEEKVKDLQSEIERLQNQTALSVDAVEKRLQSLEKRKVIIEVNTDEAKKRLNDLIDFYEQNSDFVFSAKIEFDKKTLDNLSLATLTTQVSNIRQGLSLIEKDYTVTAKNIAEFTSRIPELLKGATVNEDNTAIQLQQEVVEEFKNSQQEIIQANRQSVEQQLIDAINGAELTKQVIEQLRDDRNASVKQVAADAGASEDQVRQSAADAARLILAEKLAEKLERDANEQDMAQTAAEANAAIADSAGKNAMTTASNWRSAAQAIVEAFDDALSAVSQGFAAIASNTYSSIRRAVGGAMGNFQPGDASVGTIGGRGSQSHGDAVREAAVQTLRNQGFDQDYLNAKEVSADEVGLFLVSYLRDNGYNVDLSFLEDSAATNKLAANSRLGDKYWSALEEALTPSSGSDSFGPLGELIQDNADAAGRALTDLSSLIDKLGSYAPYWLDEADKSGGGGGGGSGAKPLDPKELKDAEDRYHEINRLLDEIADHISDINKLEERSVGKKRLAYLKQERDLLEQQLKLEQQKLEAGEENARRYYENDLQNLERLFAEANSTIGVQINPNSEYGEIANFQELLAENVRIYNEFIDRYNTQYAGIADVGEETKQLWEDEKKIAEQAYKARSDALKQYEDTINVIRDLENAILETKRNIEDNKLTEIEYKLKVSLDIKSLRQALLEMKKKIEESQGDALRYTLPSLDLSSESAKYEMAIFGDYAQNLSSLQERLANATDETDIDRIVEDLKDLNGNIYDSIDAMLDWIDQWENALPNAIDAARERFDKYLNQLDHNINVMEQVKELMALQGVSYKTLDGFNQLQKASQEIYEAQSTAAKLNRDWFERAQADLAKAQAQLDQVNEGDVAYDMLLKQRDSLLKEFNASQEALLSSAADAMKTAQQMYLDNVDRAVYELDMAASGGVGLDLLQDKMDHYFEEEGWYFDKVNELYHTTAWYNKLQADIDKTSNEVTKNRLRDLQKEIDTRREGNTLNQYDLDILEAKYNVLKAQMALEDTMNNKNTLQLVRDSQGNWNYQYTASPEDTAEKQQELLDAENEWYNITKERAQTISKEILQTWTDYRDGIRAIQSDLTLTEEERAARTDELTEFTNKKLEYLGAEAKIVERDVGQAAAYSMLSTDEMAQKLGIDTSNILANIETIRNALTDSGASIMDLLTTEVDELDYKVGSSISRTEQAVATHRQTIIDNLAQLGYDASKLTDEQLASIVDKFWTFGVDLAAVQDPEFLRQFKEAIEKDTSIQAAVDDLTGSQILAIINKNAEPDSILRKGIDEGMEKVRQQLVALGIKGAEDASQEQIQAWAEKLSNADQSLYGASEEALSGVKRRFEESGVSLNELIDGPLDELKRAFEENGIYISREFNPILGDFIKQILGGKTSTGEFTNGWLNNLKEITPATDNFGRVSEETLNKIEDAYKDLGDRIDTVAEVSGTNLDDLQDIIDQVSRSTDELGERGEDATSMWWDQIDAIQDATEYYEELARQIWAAIEAMEELADQARLSVEGAYDWGWGDSSSDDTDKKKKWENDYDHAYTAIKNRDNQALFEQELEIHDEKMADLGIDTWTSEQIRAYVKMGETNAEIAETLESISDGIGYFNDNIKHLGKVYGVEGFEQYDTGGYTGSWGGQDGKLALLHEKELVLNQKDTENLLAAVNAVRSIPLDVLSNIEKILDGNALASMGMMTSRIGQMSYADVPSGELQQTVEIQATFPNVSVAHEIEEAMQSLVNDAAQYIRRNQG